MPVSRRRSSTASPRSRLKPRSFAPSPASLTEQRCTPKVLGGDVTAGCGTVGEVGAFWHRGDGENVDLGGHCVRLGALLDVRLDNEVADTRGIRQPHLSGSAACAASTEPRAGRFHSKLGVAPHGRAVCRVLAGRDDNRCEPHLASTHSPSRAGGGRAARDGPDRRRRPTPQVLPRRERALAGEGSLPLSDEWETPSTASHEVAARDEEGRVGGTGLEPVTPSLSSWCSPN
jgi:hypothetical protein